MSDASEFKPKIAGFLCNWCCYGGADLCGVSRFQYPPYLRVIRLMCSGRVDLSFVFRAFLKGADAVFIGGCHINDCHYVPEGNYDAYGNSIICKKLLKHIGINPDRLRLEWVSAGEGIRFAEIMNDFSAKVKKFGHLGANEGIEKKDLKFRIEAVMKIIPYIKLVERERMRIPVRKEDEMHKFFDSDEFNKIFHETIIEKLTISQIVSLLRERSLSTADIAKNIGLTPSEVSRHLISSTRQKLVRYDQNEKLYALASF